MKRLLLTVLVLFILVLGLPTTAPAQTVYQNAATLKFIGLSYHPSGSPHPEIFPLRLDKQGYLVVDYGLLGGYERFFYKDIFSVKVQQGFYADCAGMFAGFSHLGWRGRIFKIGRHSFNGGIGPTLVYRRDWNSIEGYIDDGYFKRHGNWQYKFLWYGGEFEYNYRVTDQGELSMMIVPGFPEVVTLGFGYRKWF